MMKFVCNFYQAFFFEFQEDGGLPTRVVDKSSKELSKVIVVLDDLFHCTISTCRIMQVSPAESTW